MITFKIIPEGTIARLTYILLRALKVGSKRKFLQPQDKLSTPEGHDVLGLISSNCHTSNLWPSLSYILLRIFLLPLNFFFHYLGVSFLLFLIHSISVAVRKAISTVAFYLLLTCAIASIMLHFGLKEENNDFAASWTS